MRAIKIAFMFFCTYCRRFTYHDFAALPSVPRSAKNITGSTHMSCLTEKINAFWRLPGQQSGHPYITARNTPPSHVSRGINLALMTHHVVERVECRPRAFGDH